MYTPGWAGPGTAPEGDLRVLIGNGTSSNSQPNSNSASVIVYRQASLAGVLAASAPRPGPGLMAITPAQFPPGEYPVGMDIWPADATIAPPTLLVATTAGRLLRFDLGTPAAPLAPAYRVFASSLGGGLNKVKAGVRAGVPYAFVTQAVSSGSGRILQFRAPTGSGSNPPIAAVTAAGVNKPDGLAVTQ